MLDLKRFKDPILFQEAREILPEEFGPKLEQTLSDMAIIMFQHQGVGLAGPQVGDSRRILVADLGYVTGEDYGSNLIKMVNPEIVSFSEETVTAGEGCLSYPELTVNVVRPLAIFVKFCSPSGEELSQTFTDWQARIIAHEIDHLNGVTLYGRSSKFSQKRYDKKIKAG